MRHALSFSFLLLLTLPLPAQIVTGSIVGTVTDPSGLTVPDVSVTLIHAATGRERTTNTNEQGIFVFSGLDTGQYTAAFSKTGFKRIEKRNMNLSSGERLSAGAIVLELGAVTETVSVTSQAAAVKTESAERADVITSAQVDGLLIQGRNPTSLVSLLPGVVVTADSSALDRQTDFSVNGNRRTANNVSIDGIPVVDIDNGVSKKLNVNMDAVQEVHILLSNYQAEHGRNAGGNVHIVTKSGTKDFHGLGSYFKRHEQFNANNFFNNQTGLGKPRYRYNTWTYNIGGPVYIPGKLNRDRDKMFFFWSQEFWPIKEGVGRQVTMPTALERDGNFSQSFDVNNRLIVVRDPRANASFAGNIVPPSRIDPNGQALLKAFGDPNFFDRAISRGNYNYIFASEIASPKRADTLKLDYNFNPTNLLYVTYSGFKEVSEGEVGSVGAQANWRQMRLRFEAPNRALATRYNRIISANTINEFHFGWLRNPETHTVSEEDLKRNQRDAVGFRTGQFNPDTNPLNIIPNATFGGVPNAAFFRINGRFPADNRYDIFNWSDKITMTRGTHTIKAGIFVEFFRRDVNQGVSFNGDIDFGRNVNNPLDTGYAYSNAALGIFNSYSEPSARPRMLSRGKTVEWFIQDNWKATSRLTLDYGIRFYWIPPVYDKNDQISGYVDSRFDPARQVSLIAPGFNAQRQRVGVHPGTGEIYPATLIGAIAPGSGDLANGMVVAAGDREFPRALMEDRGIHFGPRIGFAYDVFGNNKTAVRGGIGMFYNRLNMNAWLPFVAHPPLVNTPVINYGELRTLLGSSGLLFPSNLLAFDPAGYVPTVTNYSFSIQQDVGQGTVVDMAYVGNLGRHLSWRRDLNPIPTGANFSTANADPTNASRPLPPSFLRPRLGHNNILIQEGASSSSYHSLQVTANRRFQRGIQFGLAWTWSKAMGFNDGDLNAISPLVSARVWNYGMLNTDRTHIVKINWLWDVPSTPWKGAAGKILNGWQISGITSFISGQPLGVGFTTVTATDITGTPSQGARTNITGNPILPKSERTFERNFRTDVFKMPAVGTFGNAASTVIRGPGINNWDVAIFKNIPVNERMRFQFRCEMYNAFNHTQFSSLDTTARFDNAGNQVNQRFGQFTGAADPRQIQLALRFYF